MKNRIVILLIFIIIIQSDLFSQWYYKRYGIPDLNYATNDQLTFAREGESARTLVYGGVLFAGGLSALIGRTMIINSAAYSPQEGTGRVLLVIGAVAAIAGLAGSTTGSFHLNKIRKSSDRFIIKTFSAGPGYIDNNCPGSHGFPALSLKLTF